MKVDSSCGSFDINLRFVFLLLKQPEFPIETVRILVSVCVETALYDRRQIDVAFNSNKPRRPVETIG